MKEEYNNLFNGNDFDELIDRYEKMLKFGKSYYFDVEDLEYILDYYVDTDQAGKALRAVKYGLRLHPEALSLIVKKAHILLKNKSPRKALATLDKIGSMDLLSNEVYIARGYANVMLGNNDQAKKEYNKALNMASDQEEAIEIMQNIAHSFEMVENYKEALPYLLEAFKLDENNLFVLQELAYCYERNAQFESALQYYNKCIEIDPFSEDVWYSIGRTYKETGDVEKAINAFEYVKAINPESLDSYQELAILHQELQNFETAIEYYREYQNILGEDEESPEIVLSIGYCYTALNKNKKALEYYNKALELDNYNPEIYHEISNIYFEQKNYWDALFYAKKATIVDDETDYYFTSYGQIASQLKLKNEAIIAFEKAVEINPKTYNNWVLLIDELIKNGYTLRTISTLEEAIDNNFGNAEIYFRLAAFLFKEREYIKALKYFRKGMNDDPEEKSIFFEICPGAKKSKEINNILKAG